MGFHRSERGAALVEFSLVFLLLMTIVIGAFEWGMGFRDSLGVASGAREAARVAASAGDTSGADCLVLEAAAGSLQAISGNQVAELMIYESDMSGAAVGPLQRYRPALPTDDPASLQCGAWYPVSQSWPESSRDNEGDTRDWVGVEIFYDHDWKTGFLWWNGSSRWSERAVMHLEPSFEF